MARLPNGCSRMLWALLQFGSLVSAVNSPSPPTARTLRSEPRTALSKRFSSLSSSTRSWPETMTSGAPIMSSQKIGPSSLVSRTKCCTGAVESSDCMLPTTGFVGGCGIGLSLLVDAIAVVSPLSRSLSVSANEANSRGVIPGWSEGPDPESRDSPMCNCTSEVRRFASPRNDRSSRFACNDDVVVRSSKSSFTPFDQLGADLVRLFLLRPMAAAANQIFLEVGDDFLHAVGRGRWQHVIVLGHDHQRRHPHGVIDLRRALPVARHVAVPVDAAGEARFGEGIDEDLLFLRRQDRRPRIVFRIVTGNHLRKRQIESRRSADTRDRRLRRHRFAARDRLAHKGVKGLLDAAVEYLVGATRGILKLHDIHLLAEALA